MALTPKQQIFEMIKKSESPLILIPQNPEGDAIASALALFLVLKKLDKNPQVACSTALAEKFLFLPEQKSITHSVSNDCLYTLSLNVGENNITQLSYEQMGAFLNIYFSTKVNSIKEKSLSLEPVKFNYDLIIILGSPYLESLGRLYFENTDIFFKTPTINIDHHASNEYFGAVNLVDVVSSSTSEIISEILEALSGEPAGEKIATLILAGIISETNSFQSASVNPKTFSLAASLVAAGANQEEIIRNLYKTKPLAVLKLIGKIVSKMNYDANFSLAWVKLNKDDFEKNSASPRDIDLAIDELVNNSRDIDCLLTVYENENSAIGNIWLDKKYDAKKLIAELGGKKINQKIVFFSSGLLLNDFEKEALAKLRRFLKPFKKTPITPLEAPNMLS